MTTNDSKKVVLNTPKDLDLASTFGAINNSKNIHKLIFLIHQANRWTREKGVFTMHKETYYKFLGLSPKDLNKYLNLLICAGLIKQTQIGNNQKKTLSEFVYLNPFEPAGEVKHYYDPLSSKTPLFIRKWCADGCAVNSTSSYKKPLPTANKVKTVMIENASEVGKEIERLKELVESLQKENAELKSQIKPLEEPKSSDDTNSSWFVSASATGCKISLMANELLGNYIQKSPASKETIDSYITKNFNPKKTTLEIPDGPNTLYFFRYPSTTNEYQIKLSYID